MLFRSTAFTVLAAAGFAAVSTLTSIAIAHGASLPNVLTWRYVLASVVMVGWVGARGAARMASGELAKFVVIGGGGQALLVGLALALLTPRAKDLPSTPTPARSS